MRAAEPLQHQDITNMQCMYGWAIIAAPSGAPNAFEVVMATELCDGSLDNVLGQLSVSDALEALCQAATGLSDMLRLHNTVHGDAKMGNVLVNRAAAASGGPLAQVRDKGGHARRGEWGGGVVRRCRLPSRGAGGRACELRLHSVLPLPL